MITYEEDAEFINLTPHDIHIMGYDDEEIENITASGTIARVAIEEVSLYYISGVQIKLQIPQQPIDVPLPRNNTFYIVSTLVRLALPKRIDLLSPGDMVRDEKGRILGCKSLVANDSIDNLVDELLDSKYWNN